MNTKIDNKSALVGLGAGVLVALVVAAASSSGSSVGRYQITATGQNGNGSECFIIDTTSGKVWKASVNPNTKTDDGFFQPKTDEK
jgi:hypothetical protein